MAGGQYLLALLFFASVTVGCPDSTSTRGVSRAGEGEARRSALESVVERVSGGKDAERGRFPWMARIDLPQGSCGGVLVSPTQVLTAAHCLQPFDKEDIVDDGRVSIGETDRDSCKSCETFRIKSYEIHPGYKPEGFDPKSDEPVQKDMAIIELNHSSDAKPARMAKFEPRPSDRGIVVGWGETETESESDTLKYSLVAVVPKRECDGFKPKNYFDGRSSICTAPTFSKPGPDGVYTSACEGDSGGPLIASDRKATVFGIVSYSIRPSSTSKCGDKAHTVFASVPESFDWLQKNLDLDDRDSKHNDDHDDDNDDDK